MEQAQEGVLRLKIRRKDLLEIAKDSPYTKPLELAISRWEDENLDHLVVEFEPEKRLKPVSVSPPPAPMKPPLPQRASAYTWSKPTKNISLFELFTKQAGPPPRREHTPEALREARRRFQESKTSYESSSAALQEKREKARADLHEVFRDLKKAFSALDIDGDGAVSLFEMKKHFSAHPHPHINDDTLEDWFEALDIDGDGSLTLDELVGAVDMLEEEEAKDDTMMSTAEYWNQYRRNKHDPVYHNPAWQKDGADIVIDFCDEHERHAAGRKKMYLDRQLLRRTVEKQTRAHVNGAAFKDELLAANKVIEDGLMHMGHNRRQMQQLAMNLQLCVDPNAKIRKSTKSGAEEKAAEQRRLEEKKRKEEFANMQDKFKSSKQELTNEYDRMQETVDVSEDQKQCRELAKQHRQWLDLSEIESLLTVFKKFDNDGSKLIDATELKHLADFMRGDAEVKVKQQEAENEMRMIDVDKSGSIDFPEYVAYVAKVKRDHKQNPKARGAAVSLLYDEKKIRAVTREAFLAAQTAILQGGD